MKDLKITLISEELQGRPDYVVNLGLKDIAKVQGPYAQSMFGGQPSEYWVVELTIDGVNTQIMTITEAKKLKQALELLTELS